MGQGWKGAEKPSSICSHFILLPITSKFYFSIWSRGCSSDQKNIYKWTPFSPFLNVLDQYIGINCFTLESCSYWAVLVDTMNIEVVKMSPSHSHHWQPFWVAVWCTSAAITTANTFSALAICGPQQCASTSVSAHHRELDQGIFIAGWNQNTSFCFWEMFSSWIAMNWTQMLVWVHWGMLTLLVQVPAQLQHQKKNTTQESQHFLPWATQILL